MTTGQATLPSILLVAGTFPYLRLLGCRWLTVLGAAVVVLLPLLHYTVGDGNVPSAVHQILASLAYLAIVFTVDRKRISWNTTGGFIAPHTLSFTYLLLAVLKAPPEIIAIAVAGIAGIGLIALGFVRASRGTHRFMNLWGLIVIASLTAWVIVHALQPPLTGSTGIAESAQAGPIPGGLITTLPSGHGLGLGLILDLSQQLLSGAACAILFGGCLNLLGLIGYVFDHRSPRETELVLFMSQSSEGPLSLLCAAAVLALQGLPLLLLHLFPVWPAELTLLLSIAGGPLLLGFGLRILGWSGLDDIPLRRETELGRLQRSSLHRDRNAS